ncbi:unnamed protein product [Haemonchus placei]|uniref:Meis_PKNOX_N domain-containing protein n=1 Tax=Haemonchus placei TaxID=6290 RepID=A0A0N4WXQ3_HAEPC|nr:unnamed protein product [Haemonchus placei]
MGTTTDRQIAASRRGEFGESNLAMKLETQVNEQRQRGNDGDMENNDESTELSNIEGLIEHCSNLIEAKYLMQHLFNACLEHAVAAAKADSHNKENKSEHYEAGPQLLLSGFMTAYTGSLQHLGNDFWM